MPFLPQIPSFFGDILFQARLTPHAVAVCVDSHEFSYQQFVRHIERVTRRLHRLQLQPAARVAVYVFDPYLRWLIIISLARMGVVSVSLAPGAKELAFVRATCLVTDQDVNFASHDPVRADASWLGHDADAWPAFEDVLLDRDTPCRLVLSSGTTGTPRKALLTHGHVAERVGNTARAYGLNATARLMTTMGTLTIGGFLMYVSCWANGGCALFTKVTADLPIARVLSMHPSVLFSSPAQLEGLMKTLPADYWPSRHLHVYVAGGRLSQRLSQAVRNRLTQSLFIIYGSTEGGTVTVAHALAAEREPGFSGYVIPPARIELVDESGAVVPTGATGEIRLRSQGMVNRYEDEPEGSDPAFREGWFYPGDLGRFTHDGGLVVVGRTRELMNIGGAKHAPETLEQAIADCPGVTDLAVFALGEEGRERPWVAVVAGDGFSDKAIQKLFADAFQWFPRLSVARVPAIPRNEMGKVMRSDLRAMVQKALDDSKARAEA